MSNNSGIFRLGQRDSNSRNDWFRASCLTAWLYPNQQCLLYLNLMALQGFFLYPFCSFFILSWFCKKMQKIKNGSQGASFPLSKTLFKSKIVQAKEYKEDGYQNKICTKSNWLHAYWEPAYGSLCLLKNKKGSKWSIYSPD